jgi:hypothetical protein
MPAVRWFGKARFSSVRSGQAVPALGFFVVSFGEAWVASRLLDLGPLEMQLPADVTADHVGGGSVITDGLDFASLRHGSLRTHRMTPEAGDGKSARQIGRVGRMWRSFRWIHLVPSFERVIVGRSKPGSQGRTSNIDTS